MATSQSSVVKSFAEVIGALGPAESAVVKSFAEVIGGLGPSRSGVAKVFAEVIADSNLLASKYVSGVVTVQGVATAGLTVRAYDQVTGALLGSATTASDGSYRIMCYANGSDQVFVAAFDPSTYQAMIFDQIQPG
ncbi:hypothetical protein [Paraburkholderia tuberum]|uniref:Carboxypeptidase regulatory-like domain-containing protein n=1 Tax=Paraburkholderia tuberum TaxID=157910 RepID=A0A1H1JBI0_9BURK|nr:hypothetical protein [Paraburkholderia tuberum]SDR46996.1 hypothetical protein SAMN05445850_4494 [Paraburkholderia tuberum]